MNDLESRLRSLTFREPPPGWRGSIVSVSSERGWQKWLAPHPAAWVALAAIWVVLALVSQTFERPAASTSTPNIAATKNSDPLLEPTLLAFHLRAAAGMEPPL
jgi:hypothetical protein